MPSRVARSRARTSPVRRTFHSAGASTNRDMPVSSPPDRHSRRVRAAGAEPARGAGTRCDPVAVRTDPPDSGPELDLLTAFLDFQRETVLLKTEGLTAEQLAQPLPTSSLTLAGLLNHLALVEDSWFRVRFAGRAGRRRCGPASTGTPTPTSSSGPRPRSPPRSCAARYAEACARSRAVVAATASLDELSVGTSTRTGEPLGPALGAAAHDRGDRPARRARRPAPRGDRRHDRRVAVGAAGRPLPRLSRGPSPPARPAPRPPASAAGCGRRSRCRP